MTDTRGNAPPGQPSPASLRLLSGDALAAVGVFVFGATAFFMTSDFSGQTRIFPQIVSGMMMFCAALLFLRTLRFGQKPQVRPAVNKMALGRSIAATLGYVALIVPLGFLAASLIYMPLAAYLVGVRNHLLIWSMTILFVGGIYLLFTGPFHTPIPRGLIFQLF